VADPLHLAKLREGISAWNRWRRKAGEITPDLQDAFLTGVFRNWSTRYGSDLSRANLTKIDLTGADLREANLGAVNMSEANLSGAYLSGANLRGAVLARTKLFGTDLFEANLQGANLIGAEFVNTKLQGATLDQADLTNALLWETQRAGWSIKGVICERVYWDRHAEKPIEFAPGEFERLYSDQTCIELFYEGGISTFELSTLPALLHHLTSKHPEVNIRLKTLEEIGGGARIALSLSDAPPETFEKVRLEATKVHEAQISLRGKDEEVSELKAMLRGSERAFDKLLDKVIESGRKAITIVGNFQGSLQTGNNSSADFRGAIMNDNSALIALIDKLLTNRATLSLPEAEENALTIAAETAKAELQRDTPRPSSLKRSLDLLKKLASEAIVKGVGKLGEKAAEADWSSLLHQLGEFIHHLH
jgi:uncharacterized protein YjbI with pentapeptide repeats